MRSQTCAAAEQTSSGAETANTMPMRGTMTSRQILVDLGHFRRTDYEQHKQIVARHTHECEERIVAVLGRFVSLQLCRSHRATVA
eukprot:585782-Prorocentrum_minimum.AAC.1